MFDEFNRRNINQTRILFPDILRLLFQKYNYAKSSLKILLVESIRYALDELIVINDAISIQNVLLDQKIGLDMSKINANFRNFFNRVILGYFNEVGHTIVGNVIAGVISIDIRDADDNMKMVIAALNRSGPAMQKLIQLIGNEVKSESLKQMLDTLKDSIEPMSDEDRTELITHVFSGENSQNIIQGHLSHWSSTNPKQLERETVFISSVSLEKRIGSASIG